MPATTPREPALLTLVTWNTDAGSGDLPRLVTDLERGTLAPASHAFLLFLQETTELELEAIARPRGWTTSFVALRGTEGRARGNAIVSSVALRDPRVVPLPRERRSRAAAAATIEVGGHDIFVASVHLENRAIWWKGLLSDAARGRQAEALLEALPADEPAIVGGDFNTWLGPNEPAWRALVRRFTDTSDWPRSPTFGDRLVLDHLFMDLPDGWRTSRWVLPDDYGSDHHPVIALVLQ